MYILNLCQEIFHEMWLRKLRSLLAIFGIVWGTLTVILLLALGQGFFEISKKDVMSIVDGAFFVIPSASSKAYQGFPKGQKLNIKSDVVLNLPKSIPAIQLVTPILVNHVSMAFQERTATKDVVGVSPDMQAMRKIFLSHPGRFLNHLDLNAHRRVTVLGFKLKKRLFNDKPALGKSLLINRIPFSIIGVIQEPSKNVYNWYDDSALIPYTTYKTIFGDKNVTFFAVLPKPDANAEQVEQDMRYYFSSRYHFAPDDKVALRVFSTSRFFQFFKWFFIGIQLFLGACGAMTLAVGALGVTNIMFLIVAERTKEIGLRRAIGAQDWHVMMQVLLETLVIVGFGGFLGFLIAYLVTDILQYVSLPEWLGKPVISMGVTITTIAVLSVLGLLAGYFPARRAARVDPVEAIHSR